MQFYYFPYLLSTRINESYASGSKSKCWSLDSLLRNDLTIVDLQFCYCSCKLQLSWCSMLIAIASQTSISQKIFENQIQRCNTTNHTFQSKFCFTFWSYWQDTLGLPKESLYEQLGKTAVIQSTMSKHWIELVAMAPLRKINKGFLFLMN